MAPFSRFHRGYGWLERCLAFILLGSLVLTFAPREVVAQTPELVVTAVDIHNLAQYEGQHVKFDITVANVGSVDTRAWGTFDVALYVDGVLVDRGYVTNVAAGGSTIVTIGWDWSGTSRIVTGCADDGKFIPESNDGNNCLSNRFELVPELSDFVPLGTIVLVSCMVIMIFRRRSNPNENPRVV